MRTQHRAARDLAWLAGLALALAVVFLWPTLAFGWRFGVGPDSPVYLWWASVAASQGISLVGARPGAPALIPAVAGTLHLPLIPAVAGLQYAGRGGRPGDRGPVRGRIRGGRPGWLLAGPFAGMFAVHLAAGYVANIAFALTFVAAAAILARRDRRGTLAAAASCSAEADCRTPVLPGRRRDPSGGGPLAWVAEPSTGLAVRRGPRARRYGERRGHRPRRPRIHADRSPRLAVDTSRDGFLRRVGCTNGSATPIWCGSGERLGGTRHG